MATLNKKLIGDLLNRDSGTLKATLYIPTSPVNSGQSVAADKTRFKNALQVIRNHHAYNERELGATLETIHKELYDNAEFWNYQDYGLAVLFDANGYEYFHLPFEITEQEYVSDHFVVSPLLITASIDTSFYLLDVNLTKPRLYYGARGRFEEVNARNMPDTFEDEVGRDEYRNQVQHQSGGSSTFHGHTEEGALDEDVRRYLKLVAAAADDFLAGLDRPLLLAGTTNRTGNIRGELNYGQVLDTTLVGNHETATTQHLYELANPMLRDFLRTERDAAMTKLANAAPSYVVMGRAEIEEAADGGRVETLFLPTYRLTGDSVRADVDQALVIDLPSDIEEVETIVTKVLQQGGVVVAVPTDALDQPKALCRY